MALVALGGVSGCVSATQQTLAKGEVPVLIGSAVRDNRTPMEGALACFADHITATQRKPVIVAVGDIKDYTGKYSINEGNAITQGGALMVYSALGKLGGAVSLAERFDPTIAERELAYTDRRQLGDGTVHDVGGANGEQKVPWLPYFGGTITKSDYYIVGGITELNYDVRSGGLEGQVNQVGPKARTYTQSVAVDLRIVDTRTLLVVKTVSLTKQLTGYEVGFNIFRFFGSDLFDINLGAKAQEPLQLGVRTALEEATMRLVGAVTEVDAEPCISQRIGRIPEQSAEQLRQLAPPRLEADMRIISGPVAFNTGLATGGRLSGTSIQIAFEFGASNLGGEALTLLDRIAAATKKGAVEVVLVARDTENFDPGKRDALIDQRIANVTAALASRGVAPGAITTTWRPDQADTSIHRDGPGLQELVKLKIGG
jgi:curli biogenesis system outer membrane secretion channel CsgG